MNNFRKLMEAVAAADVDALMLTSPVNRLYASGFDASDGAAVITLELAARFLTDYLTGDRYFRTEAPDGNLCRARDQLGLFRDMMDRIEDLRAVVRDCI